MSYLYFDNAATIAPTPDVIEFFAKVCQKYTVNASAASPLAKETMQYIEECRARLLEYVHGQNLFDFVITSSATEANNTVLKGLPIDADTILIYNRADHASLTEPVLHIAQKTKCRLLEIPMQAVGSGRGLGAFDLTKLESELTQHFQNSSQKPARLIFSAAHTHNISGVCEDMAKLSTLLRRFDSSAFIHFDGAQSLAKIAINLKEANIDSYTISGHKIGSLLGFGGFFLRKTRKIEPLLHGGKQENNLRSSTYNHPSIFTFDYVLARSSPENFQKVAALKKFFITQLEALCPQIYFPFENQLSLDGSSIVTSPYIVSIVTPGVPAEVLMRLLAELDIIVASGSACSDKKKANNSLILQLGISFPHQKNLLRLSFSNETTSHEVEQLVLVLSQTYQQAKLLADNK